MERMDLTQYDVKPKEMVNYLRYNGPHFSKKLCEFAVSLMTKQNDQKIIPISKEELDRKLRNTGISIKGNQLYDYVFAANMCKADYLGSSVPNDDGHLCTYIKDVIDDPDGYDGIVFNRWYSDMSRKGIAIDWEEML